MNAERYERGWEAWILEAIISFQVLYNEASGCLVSSEAHDRGV